MTVPDLKHLDKLKTEISHFAFRMSERARQRESQRERNWSP